MASSDTSRLIATGIRDALRQHGDIFSAIDPHEVPGQLIARLPQGEAAIEAYLKDLNQRWQPRPTILPQRGCLVRDPANSRTLRGHSSSVTHVIALPGERTLSASRDNTLRLWDLASGETLRVLAGHSRSVDHVVALSGERALSASYDNTLRLWDLANGNCESKIVADDPITTFALTTEEGRGIAGLANGKIFLFELSSVASNIA